MAGFSAILLIFVLLLICYVPSLEARKLLNMEKRKVVSYGLVLGALHKGSTPPSSPSDKGDHAMVIDEKLFTLHLAKIDRILGSTPSPGGGHAHSVHLDSVSGPGVGQ